VRTSGARGEWLVTDPAGGFAFGAKDALRTRKYHGFLAGIAGRTEWMGLADLEIEIDGRSLWPHRYRGAVSPEAPPELEFDPGEAGWPEWSLGDVRFGVEPLGPAGGIRLAWRSESRSPRALRIRPFAAMRPLHSLGGLEWRYEPGAKGKPGAIRAAEGPVLWVRPGPGLLWREDPVWHRDFYYTEEIERGYGGTEDLYSAGSFEGKLGARGSLSVSLSWEPAPLSSRVRARPRSGRPKVLDFALENPPGIVAGFPWFGEWGRDTFLSLPGLCAAWCEAGERKRCRDWALRLLEDWGAWIDRSGMLPNLVETGGSHQWQSADATLWWCHSLAALWAMDPFAEPKLIESRFRGRLALAIQSIREGRHLFLRLGSDGLLSVTEPHATWMDARIEGRAVSPRSGELPEISALWFQALALEYLWSGGEERERTPPGHELERLGRLALELSESDRPNSVFLHSIPLAPSFVLADFEAMAREFRRLSERFRIPGALRSLAPDASGYRGRCEGSQDERDRSYHQGTGWAFLGAHYEMVRDRLRRLGREARDPHGGATLDTPIDGHLPELYDGDFPHRARGAPAQAWSLACAEEAKARREGGMDRKLEKLLERRWVEKAMNRKIAV
jgi:hypothetical protein